jgi:hypothetical protein
MRKQNELGSNCGPVAAQTLLARGTARLDSAALTLRSEKAAAAHSTSHVTHSWEVKSLPNSVARLVASLSHLLVIVVTGGLMPMRVRPRRHRAPLPRRRHDTPT